MEKEDGGDFECQVTYGDGMDSRIYKIDVLYEISEESADIDLFVQPLKTLNEDLLANLKPQSESKRIKTSVERSKHSDDELNTSTKSSATTGWSENSLLLPVIRVVTI